MILLSLQPDHASPTWPGRLFAVDALKSGSGMNDEARLVDRAPVPSW